MHVVIHGEGTKLRLDAKRRRVIYHGPVGGALPFFASLGFVCPARKDPGSFLQEVTTPKGAHVRPTDSPFHQLPGT